MLAPNSSSYEDLNNYSAVLKLTYGDTSFLFTGDAEAESESEMLAAGYNLSADVLKVGHHGSSSGPESYRRCNTPPHIHRNQIESRKTSNHCLGSRIQCSNQQVNNQA